MNKTETDLKQLSNLINEIKIAMLATTSADGSIHTSPMMTQEIDSEEFNGTLWFFSKRNSYKNHSIEEDQHVTLAYSLPEKHHYLSICGRAVISEDRELMEKLWTPMLKNWFPMELNDPEMTLIGVVIQTAEIWDSPVTKTGKVMNVVKSAVTAKPFDQDNRPHHIELY